jgi:hypothetical protein
MLYKDKIAGKEYLYFNSIEELEFDVIHKIDLNNFLVGVFENTVRLITTEGMLIIINNSNPTAVYKHLNNRVLPFSSLPIQRIDDDGIEENYMRFAGIEGHALFHLSCKQCADGKQFSYQYDLKARVEKIIYPQDIEVDGTHLDSLHTPRSMLTFPLTNTQASIVYRAAEGFYEQSNVGNYITIAHIRNCITLPRDIYTSSHFNWSFLNYMKDEEIMNCNGRDSVFALGFVQDHYQVDKINNFFDPYRKKVREFTLETLGRGFEKNWDSHKHKRVDHELAKKNPFILERIQIILKERAFTCTEFIKDNLETWDLKITDSALNKICAQDPASISYFDLYYYYTHGHEYRMQKIFKDTSYAKYLNDIYRFDHVDLLCHIGKYKELCSTKMMGDLNIILTLTPWWNLEDRTELLNKFDQCFVIDESMLNSCPNIYAHDGLIRSSNDHDYKPNDWDMCGILP